MPEEARKGSGSQEAQATATDKVPSVYNYQTQLSVELAWIIEQLAKVNVIVDKHLFLSYFHRCDLKIQKSRQIIKPSNPHYSREEIIKMKGLKKGVWCRTEYKTDFLNALD